MVERKKNICYFFSTKFIFVSGNNRTSVKMKQINKKSIQCNKHSPINIIDKNQETIDNKIKDSRQLLYPNDCRIYTARSRYPPIPDTWYHLLWEHNESTCLGRWWKVFQIDVLDPLLRGKYFTSGKILQSNVVFLASFVVQIVYTIGRSCWPVTTPFFAKKNIKNIYICYPQNFILFKWRKV